MRLVRLERQQSRVADDVRAALASIGRGSTVVGGIALIGVRVDGERPIEAVVVLPHGVLIVIGVDLPDPALRLEAPLGAPWKADGWPLVQEDDAVNPATEALDLSQTCERRIAEVAPGTAPIGTIIAVGPFVETVDQPAADLAGPVRVLHPTPTTMLAATVSLATAHRPRSVEQARALINGLAPDAPEFSDEILLGEGFSRFTEDAPPNDEAPLIAPVPAQAGKADIPPVSSEESLLQPAPEPAPEPGPSGETVSEPVVAVPEPEAPVPEAPAPVPEVPAPPPPVAAAPVWKPSPVPRVNIAAPPKSRTVRWLPIAAIALLVVLVGAAIAVATGDGGNAAPPPPATNPPSAQPVKSLQFTPVATAGDQKCASHAFGDVQASLQRTSCSGVRRASYRAVVDGRPAAVTIGIVDFPDAGQADDLKAVADTPGGGGVLDLATETGQWGNPGPRFENAAYASKTDGKSARLVQVVWLLGTSTPDDPGLTRAAKAALDLPA